MKMAKLFISYSHRDEPLKDELIPHLAPLRRQGLISIWHDRRLTPGDRLDDGISQNLEEADIIVMLISADFVQSEYCFGREMQRALERHQAGVARAISVIVRPCHFHGLQIAQFVLLPTDAKAVTTWPDRDSAWVDVVNGIRAAIERQSVSPSPRSATAHPPSSAPSPARGQRSASRLPRQFTDLDRHDFLEAAFERIWTVMEANAAEFEAVNDAATVRRVRIDAQSLSIRIFVNGKELGGGSVFLGSGMLARDQICFNFDPSAPRNSMNETFSVEVVDGELKLQPMGMLDSFGGSGREGAIDADGAALTLWNAMLKQVKSRLR